MAESRNTLDQIFFIDAMSSCILGAVSLFAPHALIQAVSDGYNHNVHETLRLYACLRLALGWILFNVRQVDDGKFRRTICEALCVCYFLQAISVGRAQFTGSSEGNTWWYVRVLSSS